MGNVKLIKFIWNSNAFKSTFRSFFDQTIRFVCRMQMHYKCRIQKVPKAKKEILHHFFRVIFFFFGSKIIRQPDTAVGAD